MRNTERSISSSTVLRDERFPRKPLNGCSGCLADFASVSAFDRHRYGTYEPLERWCMDEAEMLAAGLEVDPRGRWRIKLSASDRERLQALRGSTESPAKASGEEEAA
jgi:hypothetical protein